MNEADMTLGTDWDGRQKIDGWFWSEKYDGCRAFWDGEKLWTRGGKVINAPAWFSADLPKGFALDGEIYDGLGGFQNCSEAVRFGKFTPGMKFIVFDCPQACGDWLERIETAKELCLSVAEHGTVKSVSELETIFDNIKSQGGEGLMIRNPKVISYEKGRTKNLLKIKTWRGETRGWP